jgi:broad specificity phosphatase PhoE
MRTLILIRHGEVANPNHVVYADLPGFDLSPAGVLEAHALGRHLARTRVDAVVSSPLPRAVHTANAIARRRALRVRIDDRLLETRMYPGWTGLRWDEVDRIHREQLAGYLGDATALRDVVESIDDVAQRMRMAAGDAFDGENRVVAMVGHQDPIQALRLHLLGRSLSNLRSDPPGHASATTLVSTTSAEWMETSIWVPKVPVNHAE